MKRKQKQKQTKQTKKNQVPFKFVWPAFPDNEENRYRIIFVVISLCLHN